jgi:hypothetical protein
MNKFQIINYSLYGMHKYNLWQVELRLRQIIKTSLKMFVIAFASQQMLLT